MTTWTSLFPDEATLIGRKFFKIPGAATHTVPAGAKYVRAMALGCGGQGDHWGGGGAFASDVVSVTPGDILKIQVGDVSTASVNGDSWVKRPDGTQIAYADRGRGNGVRGVAANCIGSIKRDGFPGSDAGGTGGASATDATGVAGLVPTGRGTTYAGTRAAGYGGGGHLLAVFDEVGNFVKYVAYPAGGGLVVLEYYDANPNF